MKIQKITDRNLFDAFVEKHPYSHYMKTSMWGEYKRERIIQNMKCQASMKEIL